MAQAQLIESRAIGRETIGRKDLGLDPLIAKQTAEKRQGRLRIPPTLDDKVQDLALIVHRAPHEHAPSADGADHLVEMPPG